MKWLMLCAVLLWPTVAFAKWGPTMCESLPYDDKMDAHVPANYWSYVLDFLHIETPLPPPHVILAPFPKEPVPGVDTSHLGACTDVDTGVIQLATDLTPEGRTYSVLHEYVHSALLRAYPNMPIAEHHCWMLEHQIPLKIVAKFVIDDTYVGHDYRYMEKSCQFHSVAH